MADHGKNFRRTGAIAAGAATLALVAGVAVGGRLVTRQRAAAAVAVISQREAELTADRYRQTTLGHVPGSPHFTEAGATVLACTTDGEGRNLVTVNLHHSLNFDPATPVPDDVFADLRTYWTAREYTLINDSTTSGQTRQLIAENPADGFRIALTQRLGRGLQLAVTSPCVLGAGVPLQPIIVSDLAPAQAAYQEYAAARLGELAGAVTALGKAIADDDRDEARDRWLATQLIWEHVGAAYDSFGDLAGAIGGLPAGLPAGSADPDFTGLRRIEYGLWHGQRLSDLEAFAERLETDVAALRESLPEVTINPADLPLRAHEILEDAQRDHVSGADDQGGGAGYAETDADVAATLAVVGELAPLLDERRPGLTTTVRTRLDTLTKALTATRQDGRWPDPRSVPDLARARVNAALGSALEALADVPCLLELATS